MNDEDEMVQEVLVDLILDNAISFEQDSKDFYRTASLKSISDDTRSMLETLMLKEEGHITMLRNMKNSELSERLLKIETSELFVIHGLNKKEWFITDQDDLERILDIALEREQTSVNFYSTLYQKATQENLQKLFYLLATEEKRHVDDIRSLQFKLFDQQEEQ